MAVDQHDAAHSGTEGEISSQQNLVRNLSVGRAKPRRPIGLIVIFRCVL
jgi:hypothetical protein